MTSVHKSKNIAFVTLPFSVEADDALTDLLFRNKINSSWSLNLFFLCK